MAKTLSDHAHAAKLIRKELKAAFPYTTFRVRADSFAAGDAVRIDWTDGPTTKQVDDFTGKYQTGHFDGMIDLYEYSNRRDDIPQVKYVQTQRGMSDAAFVASVALVNQLRGLALIADTSGYGRTIRPESTPDAQFGYGWSTKQVHRTFWEMSLLCPAGHATLPGDAYCPECGAAITTEEDAA